MNLVFHDKTILITGGAGAFGQKFLDLVQSHRPRRVIILSRDEMKHSALKRTLPKEIAAFTEFRIGDILNKSDLELSMRDADIVIHAAAMKHLPECESNIMQSTRVNVEGTRNVAHAFLMSHAKDLIFLSSDKAPYAASTYGSQKYIGEKIILETARRARPGQRAFTLRYSNVMDSTGSVFWIFRDLLSQGRTATVNSDSMSRGFVSQREVFETMGFALRCGGGGETFTLVPRVIRIADLAEQMRDIIGAGNVNVLNQGGAIGEKDSATLVMTEELPFAKLCTELSGRTVILDFLKHHDKRERWSKGADQPFTLEECPKLEGDAVKNYVAQFFETAGQGKAA